LFTSSGVRKMALTSIIIDVRKLEVESEPPVEVFQVEILSETGSWHETFVTHDQLKAFLRGINMTFVMVLSFSLHSHDSMVTFNKESIVQNF
jgi:hypothetical protein